MMNAGSAKTGSGTEAVMNLLPVILRTTENGIKVELVSNPFYWDFSLRSE